MDTKFVTPFQQRTDRSTGKGASADAIRAAEEELGVAIESGYVEFLRRFGWGGAGSFELYGLGDDVPSYLDLVRMTQSERTEMRPRLKNELLPIMNDGFGNLICLDTSRVVREENPMVFWNHEKDEEQQPEHVADSFSDWLLEELAS